jgi:hypothetical protein
LELGAGTAIPSVRRFGDVVVDQCGGRRIRINPREHAVGSPQDVAIASGALAALAAIEREISMS